MAGSASPSMSSALSRRAVVALLAAMAAATAMGMLAWGPVGLSVHMHEYADGRTIFGIPNAVNVLTHVPLLPLGLWGFWRVARMPEHDDLRAVWGLFFVCQMLATLGGMAYHVIPTDVMFVWDQMPKSAACALMSCAFLAERVDARWGGPLALTVALVVSVLGGAWWVASLKLYGLGDLRPLLWLEFMPTLLVATGAWSLAGRLLTRQDWMRSLISFVVAQSVDWADKPIYLMGGWISGHSIRHLALAACVGWIAYRLAHAKGDEPFNARSETAAAEEQAAPEVPVPASVVAELATGTTQPDTRVSGL